MTPPSVMPRDDKDDNDVQVPSLQEISEDFLVGGDDRAHATATTTTIKSSKMSSTHNKNNINLEQPNKKNSHSSPTPPSPPPTTKFDFSGTVFPQIHNMVLWMIGLFLFAFAILWPPLLLVLTAMATMFVPYAFHETDDASRRRFLLNEFDKTDRISASRRELPKHVHLETGYWTNDRGLLLHTTIMTPMDDDGNPKPVKAVVGFCHGYTDHPSHTKRKELAYMVEHCGNNGIAVAMIEYEGHGRSDGPLGLVSDWNVLCSDVHQYFSNVVMKMNRFQKATFFLMGESMGGAVAYTIIREYPDTPYAGVIFQCPMCKIADDMLPPDWVVKIFQAIIGPSGTVGILGYLPIAPTKGNLGELAFKSKEKLQLFQRSPAMFRRKPRLATARELLNITKKISEHLSEFDAPFLIQHGDSDKVTDPELSKLLYKEASSKDKTLCLYEGMWHTLTGGEPDENVERVMNDATQWILDRIVVEDGGGGDNGHNNNINNQRKNKKDD